MTQFLGPEGIGNLLGMPWRELSPEVQRLAPTLNLEFVRLSPEARDRLILGELTLPTPSSVLEEDRAQHWENYWASILTEWKKTGRSTSLVPAFLKNVEPPVRLFGEWIMSYDCAFVWHIQRIILTHLATRYLRGHERICEYGCGSGFNLVELRALLGPDTGLIGLERSPSAGELVNKLDFPCVDFDFFDPHDHLFCSGAVLTMGALEQLGDRFEPFLQFLLSGAKPSICVHVEPVLELYDEGLLFDWLAAQYHRRRGYLSGFLPRLHQLESEGRIELIEVHRTRFGARHNDGFSWIVWRPK